GVVGPRHGDVEDRDLVQVGRGGLGGGGQQVHHGPVGRDGGEIDASGGRGPLSVFEVGDGHGDAVGFVEGGGGGEGVLGVDRVDLGLRAGLPGGGPTHGDRPPRLQESGHDLGGGGFGEAGEPAQLHPGQGLVLHQVVERGALVERAQQVRGPRGDR